MSGDSIEDIRMRLLSESGPSKTICSCSSYEKNDIVEAVAYELRCFCFAFVVVYCCCHLLDMIAGRDDEWSCRKGIGVDLVNAYILCETESRRIDRRWKRPAVEPGLAT